MHTTPVPVLLITGPMGVGKTRVAERISDVCRTSGLAHALLDIDWLDQVYTDERFDTGNRRLAAANLTAIWPNLRAAGAERVVMARAVETHDHLVDLVAAIPGCVLTVCRLRASQSTLEARLRARDHPDWWSFTHRRTGELVALMDDVALGDVVIETDELSIDEVARTVIERTAWLDGV